MIPPSQCRHFAPQPEGAIKAPLLVSQVSLNAIQVTNQRVLIHIVRS